MEICSRVMKKGGENLQEQPVQEEFEDTLKTMTVSQSFESSTKAIDVNSSDDLGQRFLQDLVLEIIVISVKWNDILRTTAGESMLQSVR